MHTSPEFIATEHVGVLLQEARLRSGRDLRIVADDLRIKYHHLVAIEAGHFEDLPGSTYVVGFIRAYAEYLGLNAEEVVRRHKNGPAQPSRTQHFDFPPVAANDSGVSAGALLLVALVLAGCAYGVWYWMSSSNTSVADLIPEIPARLMDMIGGEDSDGSGSGSGADQAAPGSDAVTDSAGAPESPPSSSAPSSPEAVTGLAALSPTGQTPGQGDDAPTDDPQASGTASPDVAAPTSRDAATSRGTGTVPVPPLRPVSPRSPSTQADAVPTAPLSTMTPDTASEPEQPAPTDADEGTASETAPEPETGAVPTDAPEPPAPEASETAPDAAEVAPETIADATDPAPEVETAPETPAASAETDAADAEASADPAEPGPEAAPAPPPAPVPPVPETEPTPETAPEAAAETPAPPPEEPEEEPTPAYVGRAAPADVTQATGGSRIVLRANRDAWLQVRKGGRLVMRRLLRRGDVYAVPADGGYSMNTSNAGGLEVYVDGKRVPNLGPVGAPRSGIRLSPDALN